MRKSLILAVLAFFLFAGMTEAAVTFNYMTMAGTLSLDGAVVINDSSADVDTRIESNGDANAIFVDASTDRVGIFTAAPTVPLDVTGESLFTGAVGIVGAVTVTGATGITGATTITGDTEIVGNFLQTVCTIADGDATPDVAGCNILETSSNTGATEITDLDNPVVGAIYIIVGTSATNSSTITDGGNFALSAAFTASVDETITLYCQADNDYIELTRSTN